MLLYKEADEIIEAVQNGLKIERSEIENERYIENGKFYIRPVCSANNKTILKHEVITAEEFMRDD